MQTTASTFLARAASNPPDAVCVDVPLMIRLLEYAREDAKTDMDLHYVAENLTRLGAEGKTLTMAEYDAIVAPRTTI